MLDGPAHPGDLAIARQGADIRASMNRPAGFRELDDLERRLRACRVTREPVHQQPVWPLQVSRVSSTMAIFFKRMHFIRLLSISYK